MAWALGVRHPDYLGLSRSQWLGWMAWMNIRGQVGPNRGDQYVALLAQAAAGNVNEHSLTDFLPWLTPGHEE